MQWSEPSHAIGALCRDKMSSLRSALPKADLVVCRDCLPHFSFSDARSGIANLKLSGSTYLLTTHFSGERSNSDVVTGEWRPLSLTAPPFNFPVPLRLVNAGCQEQDGQFGDKFSALSKRGDFSGLNCHSDPSC